MGMSFPNCSKNQLVVHTDTVPIMFFLSRSFCGILLLILLLGSSTTSLQAEPPHVSYIFPAGGQRGTKVEFNVGGCYLHELAHFSLQGEGLQATDQIKLTDTLWFEGPRLPKKEGKKAEDYPRDYSGTVEISTEAPTGNANWYVWNSQGVTPSMPFIVGDLPEIVEQEIDGNAIAEQVELPLTINGRIFPREDHDLWSFQAEAGETITCEVLASRIGSGLDSRIVLYDPSGKRLAENDDHHGTDSRLRFTAQESGVYQLSLCDTDLGGLQNYVYRLTLTKGAMVDAVYPLGGKAGESVTLQLQGVGLPQPEESVQLPVESIEAWPLKLASNLHTAQQLQFDVDDLPEYREATDSGNLLAAPAILNGRILTAGEVDQWQFEAREGALYEFDLLAARLGSPLDAVLTIDDSNGNELATADDIKSGVSDARLTWKAPAAGQYTIKIKDRLTSRGGERYAYRLKIKEAESAPGFQLLFSESQISINQDEEKTVNLTLNRIGGFTGPVQIRVEGLPEGITVEPALIEEQKNKVALKLKASKEAPIGLSEINLMGSAEIEGTVMTQQAMLKTEYGEPFLKHIQLATTIPTPFKLKSFYEQKYIPRGSVYAKRFEVERNGYSGPIQVRLSDRQVRHLQGITGPTLTIPAGENAIEYPMLLASDMEAGRLGRIVLMAEAEVQDSSGNRHFVNYCSQDQTDQLIMTIFAERLVVRPQVNSFRAIPGTTIDIPVEVERAFQLEGPVTVSLQLPAHMKGVEAEDLVLSSEQSRGLLNVTFAESGTGPFNMPVHVRAEMLDENGHPIIFDAPLTLVADE